jgi:predicted ATPase/class 3 adenylate cyclase
VFVRIDVPWRYYTTDGRGSGARVEHKKAHKKEYIQRESGMDQTHSFGYWLRRRRKALDLTQEELARQASCALETIKKIETDVRRPSRQMAERLADVLQVAPAERAAFIKAARAELAADQIALTTEPLDSAAVATPQPATSLPGGTLTFLFTDIEGSTQLWEQHPQTMPAALARHDALLRQQIAAHGGHVFKTIGDAVCAAFATAPDALAAALATQRALQAEEWGAIGPLRVRVAIHTGVADMRDGDYFGPALNRVARLLSAGHGGQTLLSAAAWELARDHLPSDVELRDLGEHRLKDLTRPEHIFQLVAPDLPADFPPLQALDASPRRLPPQSTPLIGRVAELNTLDSLFSDVGLRLTTIIGPGGMGKSRLALAVAERQLATARFPDGVFFVELAPVDTAEQIATTIANTLDFPLVGGGRQTRTPHQQVLDHLRTKRLLLILDNCEHLLDGVCDLATAVLAEAPGVVLLATSREQLNLRGEQLFPLGGLSAAEAADAVALFAATASRLRPDVIFDAGHLTGVARICALVDGMPLAIELAASWINALTLDEIAAEIAHDLGVLESEAYDMPARHRSMRAVFDATWQRLDATERDVFAQLAVFRGGSTRAAAQAITGATLRQLHAMVGKSLLQHHPERDRHITHELLRQYAAERLAADPDKERAARERHAAYYLGALARRGSDLKGARQRGALDAIEAESENVRVAWAWAIGQQRIDLLTRALEPLGWFYKWRGRYEEGLATCAATSTALAGIATPEALLTRAIALGWQSAFTVALGHMDDAIALPEQALALLDVPPLAGCDTRAARAFLLLRRSDVIVYHDAEAATVDTHASLALARACADPWAIAIALTDVAYMLNLSGRYSEALEVFAECLQLLHELGDRLLRVVALAGMSAAARYCGLYPEAGRYAEECLEIGQQLNNPALVAQGYANVGITAWYLGEYTRMYDMLSESLAICTELGDPDGSGLLCYNHYRLCLALVALGRPLEAHAVAERGLQLARRSGDTVAEGLYLYELGQFAIVQGDYARARELLSDGMRTLQAVGAAGEANAQGGDLALADHGLGNVGATHRRLLASLRDAVPASLPIFLGRLIACGAVLLAADGRHERALELGTLVLELPFIKGSLYRDLLEEPMAWSAAALQPDIAADARERGRRADLKQTARALLAELEAAGWDKMAED